MPYKDPQKSLQAVKRHYDAHRDEVLKNKVISRILAGRTPQMSSLQKFDITQEMVNEMRAEVDLPPITIKPTRKKKAEPVTSQEYEYEQWMKTKASTSNSVLDTHLQSRHSSTRLTQS